jgi:hypothetical protein
MPMARSGDNELPFEFFLVPEWAGGDGRGRRFGGENCPALRVIARSLLRAEARCGGWDFHANAEQSASTAEGGVRSIVESIPFVDPPAVSGSEMSQFLKHSRDVSDAKLYLNFSICGANAGAIRVAIGLSVFVEMTGHDALSIA